MQQEVHSPQILHLKPVNRLASLALVLLWPKQLLDAVDSHEAAQPIPLIIVAHKEAAVTVGHFVAGAARDDVAKRCTNGFAECAEIDGVGGFVGRLLARVVLRSGRGCEVGGGFIAPQSVDPEGELVLWEERGPVLIVGLGNSLAQVVGE